MSKVFVQYVVRGNSDTTEGRGGMVDREIFVTLDEAIKCVQSGRYGVQGIKGDGEVVERKWRIIDDLKWKADDIRLWGYRTDYAGKQGYGWLDHRDAPVNDPDYHEYMRLKTKFEGSI